MIALVQCIQNVPLILGVTKLEVRAKMQRRTRSRDMDGSAEERESHVTVEFGHGSLIIEQFVRMKHSSDIAGSEEESWCKVTIETVG